MSSFLYFHAIIMILGKYTLFVVETITRFLGKMVTICWTFPLWTELWKLFSVNHHDFYFWHVVQVIYWITFIWLQLAIQAVVAGVARSIFIFTPFILFQAYGYLNICKGGVSDLLRPWCKARVPLLYGFLQSHYW